MPLRFYKTVGKILWMSAVFAVFNPIASANVQSMPGHVQLTIGSNIDASHLARKTVFHCAKPILDGQKEKVFRVGQHSVTYSVSKDVLPVDCWVTAGPDQDVDGGFTLEVNFYKTGYDLLPYHNVQSVRRDAFFTEPASFCYLG